MITRFSIITCLLLFLSACVSHTKDTRESSHFTSLGEIKVHYLLEGQGNRTIVFIHGWSCDTTFWEFQTDYFKKDYRIIVIDLPGHGKSSKPEITYTFDLFAEAVKKVIDNAGVDKAFLVGHSMGYPVARHFIKKYPQRVLGLCIVDGAYFRLPDKPEELAQWKKQNNMFLQAFKGDNRSEFIDQFIESLFIKESPLKLKEKIKTRMSGTPEHVANSAMEDMIRPGHWKTYSLSVPTLAIYAVSLDMSEDNQEYLNSLFSSLEYHSWDDAGHFLMMEKPKRFNRLLSGFLSIHFKN